MKDVTDELDFIKIKMFCSTKGNIKRMRRQATDWEEMSARTDTQNIQRTLKIQQQENHPIKNRPNTLTDISPKISYIWHVSI